MRQGDGSMILPGRRVSLHLMVQPGVAARLFSNRDLQVLFDPKAKRFDDIDDTYAAGDDRRMFVDHAVVQVTCRLVAVITGQQQLS